MWCDCMNTVLIEEQRACWTLNENNIEDCEVCKNDFKGSLLCEQFFSHSFMMII